MLAIRLTDKPATERSHEKPPEPVKVSHGLLWDFNARKDTKKEVRGSCRRPQRELLPRISTWEGLARGASSATNYFLIGFGLNGSRLFFPVIATAWKIGRGPLVKFMTNQRPVLKLNFGRLNWQGSENEEAVQSDETARQSNSRQASIVFSSEALQAN